MKLELTWFFLISVGGVFAQEAAIPGPADLLTAQIEQKCRVKEAGADLAKLSAARTCVHAQYQIQADKMAIATALQHLDTQAAAGVALKCKTAEADNDSTKVHIAMGCVQTATAAQESIQKDLDAIKKLELPLKSAQAPPIVLGETEAIIASSEQPEIQSATVSAGGAAAAASKSQAPAAGATQNGEQVGSSAYSTPSACVKGASFVHPELIGVRRELLAPKEASDIYGRRLGRRYFIYQVRVSNYSKDFQYVVHDITVDLKGIVPLANGETSNSPPEAAYLASTRELSLLRGIPEKGQDLDPRNLTLHVLQGVGAVAGGVSGLTAFTGVMGSAVAVFNGAFLQAYVGIAPDHTATQLNRLSDEAFASNTLVDKLHTKVFAVFVPEAIVLDTKDQNEFWGKPRDLLAQYPLDTVDVCVDGSLVTEVATTPSPAFSVVGPNVAPNTNLTMSDGNANAVIYYTKDGNTPTTDSTKYIGPIELGSLGETHTIQAIALAPNQAMSPVISQSYSVFPKAGLPSANIPAGAETSPFTLHLALPAEGTGLSLWYTTDGSNPLTSSSVTKSEVDKDVQITPPATVTVIATGPNNAPSDPLVLKYTKK